MRGAEALEVRGVVRAAVDLRHDVVDIGGAQPACERWKRHHPLAQRMAQELTDSPQTPRSAVPALGRGPSPAVQAATLTRGDPKTAGARVCGHAMDGTVVPVPTR